MAESGTPDAGPTPEQVQQFKDEVQRERQEMMDEMTEYDHITRFFKNKCFAFADEAEQTSAISSLINCEDKFVEAYMVTVGKVYQESRKRVFAHYSNIRTLYLFLTAEESLMDTDGHRINNLVAFVTGMYNNLLKLRSDALTLCEAIRQIKTSHFFPLHGMASFHRVWRHIAEIMYQFAVVDHLSDLYPNLGASFCEFQLKIKKHFDSEFTDDQKKHFDEGAKAQEEAQSMILKGHCFRALYESAGGEMDNNQSFASEMRDAITDLLNSWEKSANTGNVDGRLFCGISALTVYYYHHFSNFIDHSLMRKVVVASRRVPYHRALGEEIFIPGEFLRRQVSNKNIIDSKLEAIVKKIVVEANTVTRDKLNEMVTELKEYCEHAVCFIKEFEAKKMEQTQSINKLPQWGLDISELFLKSIRILETITRDLYLIVRAKRAPTNVPEIDKVVAFSILSAIESAKKLEMFLMDNWGTIEEGSFLARQQWRKHMLRILSEARKSYVSCKSKNVTHIEASTKKSFYHIAEAQCTNEMIPSRTVVLGLAYEIGRLETHISGGSRKQVYELMSRLETFNSPRRLLQKAAYTGLLLRHTWLTETYFDSMFSRRPTAVCVEGFTNALGGLMEGARETGQTVRLMTKLKEDIHERFLEKAGTIIDIDLRVTANPDLKVDLGDEAKLEDLDYIIYAIRKIQKFQVGTTVIPIKESLEQWLDEEWYKLQILTPNSAKTYTWMKELAKMKYDLDLMETDLPQADIDETVVILDLIRNISTFVTNYTYFSQGYLFVEKASQSKRLHVIRLEDFRTALAKHGIGLLPTAVNAAYMVIRNKMQTFLNFLSDDTVRNQIQRYLNELDANRSDAKKRHSYKVSWAVMLLKNLSKAAAGKGEKNGSVAGDSTANSELGDEIPHTYFDMFRSIVTQIGNAISLVRMISQAARENGYTRQDLFPLIKKNIEDLETTSRSEMWSNRPGAPINCTKVNATIRLGLVKELFERVSEHRNYTKMMCVEFKTLLLQPKVSEDKIPVINYFHGVVPALTVSYVNYMLAHVNRVKKTFALKHNKDLVVADDGFAAGTAFLLHVLDDWEGFSKLNWFESYVVMKDHEIRAQSENRQFSNAVQMKIERLQTELKIFNNFRMNFGIQHTIFTTNS